MGFALACVGQFGLWAAEAPDSLRQDDANLWEELQDLPPELAEALPEDLRVLLEEMKPGAWQTLLTTSGALGYRENIGLNPVAPVAASVGGA